MDTESTQHTLATNNNLVVFPDVMEAQVLKLSPRSMESGDDTGDDLSISYPSPANPSPSITATGKPSPTRIKIVKHRKILVKRRIKQQPQPSPDLDQSVQNQTLRQQQDNVPPAGGLPFPTIQQQQLLSDNDNSNTDMEEEIIAIPKPGCRYGAGCTHMADPSHRMKFWHPIVQELTEEEVQSNFICNECGYATKSLPDLQLHLKRKTAWSNESLVGCRINCLIDSKEWLEGYVCQYHKSGKHRVEFRVLNEKKWMMMKKSAFYIIERPTVANNYGGEGEVKDNEDLHDNLAPIEDWTYCEAISVQYAFAQSVLFKICGNALQETGHLTKGHVCLTEDDKNFASEGKCSLLYGELLPRGANKAMESERLNVGNAKTLFDLGMGTGKILIQAFLQFRNLRYVYGVELAEGRYRLAEELALRMIDLLGPDNYTVKMESGKYIVVVENPTSASSAATTGDLQDEGNEIDGYIHMKDDMIMNASGTYKQQRILHFQCGNMFDCVHNIHLADVVMMETDIPNELYYDLHVLLSHMKDNSRMLSYLDFRKVFQSSTALNLKQLEINKPLSDRYPTSWSVQRGHHFFLWIKSAAEDASSNSAGNWGMNMTSLKKQQSDIDRRSPVSDNDSESDDSSAMDQCLPFFFCSYLSASVASSRVTSPVKPMKILSDKESHGSPGSDVGPLLINDNNLSPSRKLAKNDVNNQHQNQNEISAALSPQQNDLNSPIKVTTPQPSDVSNSTSRVDGKKKKKSPRDKVKGGNDEPLHNVVNIPPVEFENNLSTTPSPEKVSPRKKIITKTTVDCTSQPQELQIPVLKKLSPRSNASSSDLAAFPSDIRSRLVRTGSSSPRPSPDKSKGSNKDKSFESPSSNVTIPSISPRERNNTSDHVDKCSQPDPCVVANGDMAINNTIRNGSDVDNYSNLNILNDQATKHASFEVESFARNQLIVGSNLTKSCEALAYHLRSNPEESSPEVGMGIQKVPSGKGSRNQHSSGGKADGRRKSSSDQSSIGEFRRDCSDTRRSARRRSNQESSCSIQ